MVGKSNPVLHFSTSKRLQVKRQQYQTCFAEPRGEGKSWWRWWWGKRWWWWWRRGRSRLLLRKLLGERRGAHGLLSHAAHRPTPCAWPRVVRERLLLVA